MAIDGKTVDARGQSAAEDQPHFSARHIAQQHAHRFCLRQGKDKSRR